VQLKIVLKDETPSTGNGSQSPNFVQRDNGPLDPRFDKQWKPGEIEW
jgi:hypothetical protein